MAKRTVKDLQVPVLNLDARSKYVNVLDKCYDVKKKLDPLKKLFSLFLLQYIRDDAKELHYSPVLSPAKKRSNSKENRDMCFSPDASRINYNLTFTNNSGSKYELIPPPNYMFEAMLEKLGKWGLMEYNPYSDNEQSGTFNARFNGKDNLLELYVRQSKYGREIVVKRK